MQMGLGFIYSSDNASSPSMYHLGPDLHLPHDCPRLSPGVEIVVRDPVSGHTSCPNIDNVAECWGVSEKRHQLS